MRFGKCSGCGKEIKKDEEYYKILGGSRPKHTACGKNLDYKGFSYAYYINGKVIIK